MKIFKHWWTEELFHPWFKLLSRPASFPVVLVDFRCDVTCQAWTFAYRARFQASSCNSDSVNWPGYEAVSRLFPRPSWLPWIFRDTLRGEDQFAVCFAICVFFTDLRCRALLELATGLISDCYHCFCCSVLNFIYLSDFVKTWPLGLRLAPCAARLQAGPVPKNVEGLTSWSVQLDSPGTALTVGGWIRPGGQN